MAGVGRRGREVIGDNVREVSPVSRSQIKMGFQDTERALAYTLSPQSVSRRGNP